MKKMISSKHFRKSAMCGLAMMLALSVTGCSFGAGGTTQRDYYYGQANEAHVYVIGQSNGIQFWDSVAQGAKEAGEELNYDVHYANAESISDVDGQIQLVREAISAKADAIVLAPNDPTKLNEAIRDAREAGIYVLTIDADVDNEDLRSAYIGTVNAQAGAIAGKQAASLIEDPLTQKALIIGHSESSTACAQRVGGFTGSFSGIIGGKIAAIMAAKNAQQGGPPAGVQGGPPAGVQGGPPADAQQGEADANTQGGPPADVQQGEADANTQGGPPADAQQGGAGAQQGGAGAQQGGAGAQGGSGSSPIAAVRYCNGNADIAKQITMEMISANPDIKLVYATNERSTLGVCEAIKELDKEGEIKIVGFNSNNTELEYLKSGTLTGLIIQNPYNMGYLGVYYAGVLVAGKTAPHSVDTGATYISMENFDSDEVQLMLDPAGFIAKNSK